MSYCRHLQQQQQQQQQCRIVLRVAIFERWAWFDRLNDPQIETKWEPVDSSSCCCCCGPELPNTGRVPVRRIGHRNILVECACRLESVAYRPMNCYSHPFPQSPVVGPKRLVARLDWTVPRDEKTVHLRCFYGEIVVVSMILQYLSSLSWWFHPRVSRRNRHIPRYRRGGDRVANTSLPCRHELVLLQRKTVAIDCVPNCPKEKGLRLWEKGQYARSRHCCCCLNWNTNGTPRSERSHSEICMFSKL